VFGSGDDDIVVVYGIGGGNVVSCIGGCIGAVDDFALSLSVGGGGSDNCSFCRLSA
jgi:hypothetical protein